MQYAVQMQICREDMGRDTFWHAQAESTFQDVTNESISVHHVIYTSEEDISINLTT